jgi:hypothetical protein
MADVAKLYITARGLDEPDHREQRADHYRARALFRSMPRIGLKMWPWSAPPPAGPATAVYTASEGLSVIVFDARAYGGEAGESARIENYLGFPTGISGRALTGGLSRKPPSLARRWLSQSK